MIKVTQTTFKWSTSEQIYPLEKDTLSRILYCKEIDFGTYPNSGNKQVAHGISSLDCSKIFKEQYIASNGGQTLSATHPDASWGILQCIVGDYVYITTGQNYSGMSGVCRLVYAK